MIAALGFLWLSLCLRSLRRFGFVGLVQSDRHHSYRYIKRLACVKCVDVVESPFGDAQVAFESLSHRVE